jgi:hypothetical protein
LFLEYNFLAAATFFTIGGMAILFVSMGIYNLLGIDNE